MSDKWSKAIAEVLNTGLDCSEVYETETYKRLERRISEHAEDIYKKIDADEFADYREARIDMESLFYKFGFIDGVRFLYELTSGSPDEFL